MRLLPLLLVALLAAPAAAQQEPAQGVNVAPAADSPYRSDTGTLVELGEVTLGQPVQDAVVVRSSFDVPTTVSLYAADALPARGGGFGFTASGEDVQQVGRWLVPSQSTVTVPADGAVTVPYTVLVPAGTAGGEYVGAVVAEPVEQSGGGGVSARTRFAMAVYLRVPGGAEGATPGRGTPGGTVVVEGVDPGFDAGRACPTVTYRNDSQDVVDVSATVTASGLAGSRTYTQERVGALLPATSASVALPCLDRPFGAGTLQVVLTSEQGRDEAAVDYTWAPVPLVLSLLLLVLVAAGLLATLVRGLRRRRGPVAPDGMPSSQS